MGLLACSGINNKSTREEEDFYATDPLALTKLLKYEVFNDHVWEPACGEGNLSNVLKEYGYDVYSTDLIDRGYQDEQLDFLSSNVKFNGDIITNPPFKHTIEFILKSLESVNFGSKVCMLLPLNYLSGKRRYKEIYSKYPPSKIYIFKGRITCSKNNKPEGFKGGAITYAWFIWEKGILEPTYVKWLD